jgi:hypothetical protein
MGSHSDVELGCDTGEHTLLAAEQGLPATGVDLAPTAIAKARDKAEERGFGGPLPGRGCLERRPSRSAASRLVAPRATGRRICSSQGVSRSGCGWPNATEHLCGDRWCEHRLAPVMRRARRGTVRRAGVARGTATRTSDGDRRPAARPVPLERLRSSYGGQAAVAILSGGVLSASSRTG